MASYADAISGIESGGRYDLLGPVTKSGDQAYGKYQVMGANVPGWTKQVLGQELTPQEFLASPEAQDAVFNGIFGGYVNKYGPEGAAKAWFAGEKGMKNPDAKDMLGTSVAGYGQRFMSALGQGAPQQPASAPPVAGPSSLGLLPNANPAPPAGLLGQQPQQQSPGLNVASMGAPEQSQPQQMAAQSVLPALHRRIDLTKLRQMLGKA